MEQQPSNKNSLDRLPISMQDSNNTNINQQNEKTSNWNDDKFSTLTIEDCKKHFELYENDVDHLITDTKDKLSLLRSCVELLNRLEDTNEDSFAGRVLIFLAKAVPLFDASGLNPRSEFNVKKLSKNVVRNLKEISEKNAAKDQELYQLIDRDMEEGETISDDDSSDNTTQQQSSNAAASTSKPPQQEDVDRIFERFWKMQKYFNLPYLIYDKNQWFTFQSLLSSFVAKMEQPTNLKEWNLKSSYMTDPKSLCLQLNDINMRRCFLVQILIILQYLELPVETRPIDLALEKMQLDWSAKLTEKIYRILGTLPNQEEGKNFLGLVRHILKREEFWNRWKNEKCKEPKLIEEDDEFVIMGGTYQKRRKISDEIKSAKSSNSYLIGSPTMSRLWNLKQNRKLNQPNLNTYLKIPTERQAESFKDPNYSIRLLRLLRRSPDFFTQTTQPIQSLDEYLKTLAKNNYNNHNNSNSNNNNVGSNNSSTNKAVDEAIKNGTNGNTKSNLNISQRTSSSTPTSQSNNPTSTIDNNVVNKNDNNSEPAVDGHPTITYRISTTATTTPTNEDSASNEATPNTNSSGCMSEANCDTPTPKS